MPSRRNFLGLIGLAALYAAMNRWPGGARAASGEFLTIMGATSCMSYVKQVLPRWESSHRWVRVAVSGGGSYAGLQALAAGDVALALADVEPPPGYVAVPLDAYPLGRLAVLLVAHKSCGVAGLSRRQAAGLFTGQIRNWREVGGDNVRVISVCRPQSSGARAVVQQNILGRELFSPRSIIQISNGAVMRTVMDTPGALGYIEATGAARGVSVLRYGTAAYDPDAPQPWPLYAAPCAYVRRGAPDTVRNLAEFLHSRPERRRFGIYDPESRAFRDGHDD